MSVTHATEFGLGFCARVNGEARGGPKATARFKAAGLRGDTRACDGSPAVYNHDRGDWCHLSITLHDKVPTCPRCAVLRDEALEGRLPVRAK